MQSSGEASALARVCLYVLIPTEPLLPSRFPSSALVAKCQPWQSAKLCFCHRQGFLFLQIFDHFKILHLSSGEVPDCWKWQSLSPAHIFPHALLPMTTLPWDISLCDIRELTSWKAGKIHLKHASRNILVTKQYSRYWSYCKKGENIYPTGKEGEGAILCFIHQLFSEEKRENV